MLEPRSPALMVTSGFPPGRGGSAALLYELLRHFPEKSLVVLHQAGSSMPDARSLPFDTRQISIFGSPKWTDRIIRHTPWIIGRLMEFYAIRMAQQYRVHAVYAHYPDALSVVAAWKAARRLKLPLVVYFDILWEEATEGYVNRLAKRYEHRIVNDAIRRFAITEFAADHLQRKHGVPWEVIPHTLDASQIADRASTVATSDRPIIHFAGTIYRKMNLDSLQRLIEAQPRCRTRPVLDLCTAYRFPASSPDIRYRFLSRNSLVEAQRQASLLFLPQAFQSSHPVMIRNNLPTKITEYLLSGTPILVHSPRDSYLSWLAKREGFGYVVDEPDTEQLALAIDRVLTDQALREELVTQARRFATSRDSSKWWPALYQAIHGPGGIDCPERANQTKMPRRSPEVVL